MLLYQWLKDATRERGNAKALVYRDTYLGVAGSHPTLYNATQAGLLGSVSVREFFTK